MKNHRHLHILAAGLLALVGATAAQAQNPLSSRTVNEEIQQPASTATRASVIAEMHRYAAAHGTLERTSLDDIQAASSDVPRSSVVADMGRYVASGHSLERHSQDELQTSSSTVQPAGLVARVGR